MWSAKMWSTSHLNDFDICCIVKALHIYISVVAGAGPVPAVEAVADPAPVAAAGAEAGVRAGARVVHDQGQTKDQGQGPTRDQGQGLALNREHPQHKRTQKMINDF